MTNFSHSRLHHDETLWTGKLVEKKGIKWWKDLMAKKELPMKIDVHYYISEYDRLKKILEKLKKNHYKI